MTYSTSFLRHQMIFSLADGETASCRVHWRPSSPLISLSGEVDTLATKASDLWDDVKGGYTADVKFLGSRVQLVGDNGLVVETEERFTAGVAGTSPTPQLPTEVALVVSLRTASASKSGRGRFYWPGPSTALLTFQGRFDGSAQTAWVAFFATYLAPFTEGAVDFDAVVASEVQQALRPVVQVRLGDVFDVQRRRRDAIPESYEFASV